MNICQIYTQYIIQINIKFMCIFKSGNLLGEQLGQGWTDIVSPKTTHYTGQ